MESLQELNRLLEDGEAATLRVHFRKLVTQFPTSAVLWYSWQQWEWRHENYAELETLFGESLRPHGDVRMWRLYLQYVRLCNTQEVEDTLEVQQTKRATVGKAYELALSHVGVDLFALSIYRDYIRFLQETPVSSSSLYEQQVQMDLIRKVYTRALAVPLDGIEGLWHEYDAYEGNLNKVTAKKMLADRSAAYMTARTVSRELKALLESLDRDEYALDPPTDSLVAARKVAVWQRWIDWEKGNPLGVPERSPLWIQRVQYAYRQALAVLRFYGEVWFEYSRFLVIVGRREEAETIIKTAVEALPVDLIVVFAYADLLETAEGNNGEVKSEERTPNAAGPVYEALIEALDRKIAPTTDEDSIIGESKSDAENVIKENLTLAWIQYMNFARRTDGIAAARAVFTRARKSVNTSHHLFLAAARMEYHCKKDAVVAGKIFELGMARFNRHPEYILAYLQHLLATGDEQNARALFERAMLALGSGGLEVWKVYLDHAFRYGDRASIRLLVQRFQDAFPGHILARDITLFCRLYSYDEAAVGPERLWTFLQGVEPLATPRSTIPRPFFISELIMDLIDKLPSAATYDGPAISPDALVKLLQVVNLIPSEPKPTRITRPSSGITSSKTTNTKRRRARDRLDDGDHRDIPTSAPVRTDDLFAQRRRRE